jgi:hypothetical protein
VVTRKLKEHLEIKKSMKSLLGDQSRQRLRSLPDVNESAHQGSMESLKMSSVGGDYGAGPKFNRD